MLAINAVNKLINQIFGETAEIFQHPDRAGYILHTNILGDYYLEYGLLTDFDKMWRELWSIKNSIVIYIYSTVVAA